MGGSGNTDNLPLASPKLANLSPSKTATIEQARPVPYLFGLVRVGVTFLGEPFNVHQDPVYQDTKKEPIQSGFNNYGSFVALVGIGGTTTRIYKVVIDDEVVWEGNIGYSSDYQDITVTGRGVLRFYFGTETQTIDSNLPLDSNGDPLHPAYRGQCYVILLNWFIGYNQSNLGNVQLELGRYPAPGWQTASANVQADLNPVSLLWDWWTNKRVGLGQSDDRLDTADLDDVATQLAGECVGVSAALPQALPARQAMQRMCEHIGGYLKRQPSGKLTLGLERPILCAVSVPEFDEEDLLAVPEFHPGDWADTFNRVYVKFLDRNNALLDDAAPYKSPTNVQLTGAIKTQIVDRTWITRQVYAQQLANILGPTLAIPRGKGKLRVRRSRLQGVKAGDVFKLSYGHLGICHFRARATAVRLAALDKPEVEIEFKEDTSNFNARYSAVNEHEREDPTTYEPEPIVDQVVLEIPYTPRLPVRMEVVAFLATRPTNFTTKFAAWRQLADTSYAKIQNDLAFVQRATLYADYPVTTLIDETATLILQLAGVDLTLPLHVLDEAVLNGVLVWIGDELLSIYAATLIAAGRYECSAIRARHDTRRAAHTSGDEAWIFYPARLVPYAIESAANPQTFKLQPYTFSGALDLGDATALNLTRTQRTLRPATPLNLRAYGDASPAVPSGNNLPVTWHTATNERTAFWPAWTANLPETEIEVLLAGAVVLTETVAAGVETLVIDNADLVAALGSEVDFTVRAYHVLNGYRSALYAEMAVTWGGSGGGSTGNLIPAMTSNTSPSGEAHGSPNNADAWRAFDHNQLGGGIGGYTSPTVPAILQYRFPAAQIVTSYAIFPFNNLAGTDPESPQDWTFEGSNDGGTWDVLDTRTGITAWTWGTGNLYSFANTTAYLYYRLNITVANVFPTVAELEMYL